MGKKVTTGDGGGGGGGGLVESKRKIEKQIDSAMPVISA